MLAFFGILAAVVSTLGFIPYVRDILRGKTKPQRSTWLIWTALSTLALAGQIGAHARWSVVISIAQALTNFLILGLAVRRGVGGFAARDWLSIAVAGIGLSLWLVTNNPLLAIVAVIVADAAGAWLTISKAYHDPSSETLITWFIDAICFGIAAAAVGSWNVTLLLYPIYLVAANSLTVAAIYLGRRTLKA